MITGKTLKDYPNLLSEWDYKSNNGVDPLLVPSQSNKPYVWKCSKGHSWSARPNDRINSHTGCPYCSNRKVLRGFNDLATTHPNLIKEWDFEKNINIGPYDIVYGTSKKVWWKCEKGHSWEAVVSSRTSGGKGCPYCAGQKVWPGFNDLETLYPEIVKSWDYQKNEDLIPSHVLSKTKKQVWWKCDYGHSYKMAIVKKTSRGFGCPVCSNYRIVPGINDLATTHPHLVFEWDKSKNGSLTPQQIGRNSTKKVWWVCQKGHEWQAKPHDRTQDNTGCPICAARRNTSFPEQAIYYYVKKIYPDTINRYKDVFDNGMELDVYIPSIKLGIEFDGRQFHKNEIQHNRELTKYEICKSNGIQLIRVKEKHDYGWKDSADDVFFIPKEHNYKTLARIIQHILNYLDTESQIRWGLEPNPTYGIKLPPESTVKVDLEKDKYEILSYLSEIPNSIAKTRPDVAEQWDYINNDPLKPEMFSIGSNEKVWWICTNCGKSYKCAINHKNRHDSRVCPECANEKSGRTFTLGVVAKVGSMRQTHPALAKEFHPTKNGEFNPDNITAGRFKKVWWLCSSCGFEWEASPNLRKRGIGCPHCSGRVPMPGVDDLLTVNPDLCKEWNYSKNKLLPSQYLPHSGKKVWWICNKCNNEWEATINARSKGHGCPKCPKKKNKM